MTTAAWSTVLDQTSDAAFRTWGSELSTKFAAVGMVQTADTGQINWTTVTRAAVINTAAGYEIWKLSSGNLYFKIEYGTGSTQPTTPALFLTCGTGSNGSGTITGQSTTRTELGDSNLGIISTVTNYQSYLCATANYFGLAWKIGSSSANRPRTFMSAMQTVDSTGAATSIGYLFLGSSTSSQAVSQCVATAAAVTGAQIIASNNGIFFIPNNSANPPPSSSDGSGNNQAWLFWYSILGTTPQLPLLHCCAVLTSDLALGVTASMTLIGSTPHTYINAGTGFITDAKNIITNTNISVAMVWE